MEGKMRSNKPVVFIAFLIVFLLASMHTNLDELNPKVFASGRLTEQKDGTGPFISGKTLAINTDYDWSKNNTAQTPILIDQGHANYYTLGDGDTWSYYAFMSALEAEGYEVESTTSPVITLEELSAFSAFIIPLAQNSPTAEEIQAMQQYVEDGGALFLIADWGGTFSDPSQALANVFGVTLDANTVTDPSDYIGDNDFWVTYDIANFSSHILMAGLNLLQTYASTGMLPGTGTPLITTDSDATPPDRAIAVALNYGSGRVVVVGDSNYFSETTEYPGTGLYVADNKDFAVNIVNWLTKTSIPQPPDPEVAFFDDGENGTTNWVAASPWSLVIVDTNMRFSTPSIINHAWTDSPEEDYSNNTDSSLTSISIDVSTLSNPTLSFLTRYDFEPGSDYGYVEVSTDDGATWLNVATYTGTNAEWTLELVGLRNFEGVTNLKLRFRLVSNADIAHDGWYIDDVKISSGAFDLDHGILIPLILNQSTSMQIRSDINETAIEVINPMFTDEP
jgi:hypothetical protein